MNKKSYIFHGMVTLVLLAPYMWLLLDILDKAGYKRLLKDALLVGPCIFLIVFQWVFVISISKNKDGIEEES